MSIEVDWNRLTGGPEGEALAATIKDFVHNRLQQIQLPRFIRSVQADSFHFGDVTPHVEVKDVCDPLPDFYESDEDEESPDETRGVNPGGSQDASLNQDASAQPSAAVGEPSANADTRKTRPGMPHLNTDIASKARAGASSVGPAPGIPPRAMTAGIPGGTSNMSYFHLPLSAGLSGASTPMGASASRFGGSLLDHLHHNNSHSNLHRAMSPPPHPIYSPPTLESDPPDSPSPEDTSNDLQIVTRLKYDGNVRLSLTAEVAFDYPMQSFVGIPLQLNVTGLTFDGVAILAYIKHKAHFCFLAPEDADALVGGETTDDLDGNADDAEGPVGKGLHRGAQQDAPSPRKPVGGLFEEIRVESEIGQREKGKQVLKNIGKVEKFVLDQVRRIFETELVYPSFWTFLV